MSNIYLQLALKQLPRVLALFDTDQTSHTFGCADRRFWGWKLSDFPDASFQRLVYGLALLFKYEMLPKIFDKNKVFKFLDSGINAIAFMTRKNGSVDQAFPYESSFGATAFVAYDILSCIDLLKPILNDTQYHHYLNRIAPLVRFVSNHCETHGFISNHIAAACCLLYKWEQLTGESHCLKAQKLLTSILKHQSDEGWYLEYLGADPGYQTLCTYYLADLNHLKPELGLAESLKKSVEFLSYFAHPDGSFGGQYGSRNTRFYYPAGIELLANESEIANSLARHMRHSISESKVVTIDCVDTENLIPLFNYYASAAVIYEKRTHKQPTHVLPSFRKNPFTKHFKDAGIYIHHTTSSYTIISLHKGGLCYHFNKHSKNHLIKLAPVYTFKKKLYSPQSYNRKNVVTFNKNSIVIDSDIRSLDKIYPSPAKFILLRILNLTLMRISFIAEIIKKLLARSLITGHNRTCGINQRHIELGSTLKISDKLLHCNIPLTKQSMDTYSTIHMASQGYYQVQDFEVFNNCIPKETLHDEKIL